MGFATFWNGEMDAITYGCLASFPFYGQSLTLYSYASDIMVPPGVILKDAREICSDESLKNRYFADGKVEFAKFANLFRYLLLQKTDLCWVDADMLCVDAFAIEEKEYIFGAQFPAGHVWEINNAILKLPAQSPILQELIDISEKSVDLDQHWGVIGPELVTSVLRKFDMADKTCPQEMFYPITPDDFWLVLFDDEFDHVKNVTKNSKMVHLWHNNFKRNGYNKKYLPPVGSFLYEQFSKFQVNSIFPNVYTRENLVNDIYRALPAQKIFTTPAQRYAIECLENKINHLKNNFRFVLSNVKNNQCSDILCGQTWRDVHGNIFEFMLDGKIKRNENLEGSWFCWNEEEKKILAFWGDMTWIDLMVINDGIMSVENNVGHKFYYTKIDNDLNE